MTSRNFSITVACAMVLLTISWQLYSRYEKYNDPDTPKIRASFTVAPDTDDIQELRAFFTYCHENWSEQMRHRYKDYEDYELFLYEMSQAKLDAAGKILTILYK